ncbi:MAG: hypothetical protein GJ677_03200 [Rhodobacteraceae bacterium]|nr:hypothetical protein [Paracoccaceae bacterium]
MSSESGEISRLEQANTLGLAFMRTIVLLNGGGILALLTYLGNASAQTQVQIGVASIKLSIALFLAGITSVLMALVISYTFTASAPETRWSRFWNSWIIPLNGVLALVSVVAFVAAVLSLLFGAHAT